MGETWSTIRIGTVVAVDYDAIACRVHFPELDLTSDWLPVLQANTKSTASFAAPDENSTVLCLFYSDGTEEGVVVGAMYTPDEPGSGGAGMVQIRFGPNQGSTLALSADGKLYLSGNARIEGALEVTGDLTVGGAIHCTGIVYAADFIKT